MNKIRYNPINNKKIVVAKSRTERTFLPTIETCPLRFSKEEEKK
jgi:galactose-1-phosphate uridylyltransferase